MSIDQFVLEMKEKLDNFARHYREWNDENPGQFPISVVPEEAGAWDKMFKDYCKEMYP